NRLQTFERPFLNHATLEFTKWTIESVSARAIFVNQVSTLIHTGNIHERGQRQRRVEVVVCINLVRRDQDLWSGVAVSSEDPDVINGDDGFESKLDLGPDDTVFGELQI